MKVSEMIEWLKTQNPDAEVQVVHHYFSGYRNANLADWVDFDPNEHAEYIDFTLNPWNGKSRVLFLGEIE